MPQYTSSHSLVLSVSCVRSCGQLKRLSAEELQEKREAEIPDYSDVFACHLRVAKVGKARWREMQVDGIEGRGCHELSVHLGNWQ